ncbi:MAG: hypothetical protein LBQ71_17215 [Hungatella sp.]|jgi:hypothetical protein|nr:hypothetical protein [Hungatella sp.]
MKIEKVLNNNMVSAYNTEGKEIILKGKAIGFGKKKGDEVDRKLVEGYLYRMISGKPDTLKSTSQSFPRNTGRSANRRLITPKASLECGWIPGSSFRYAIISPVR